MLKDNLKTIRKYRHFSQEKLAEKIGVSRQSVSKWETGESYPTMANMLAICSVTHCKITDLVDLNSEESDCFPKETKRDINALKEKDYRRLKKVSKIIYIVAKIARFASLLGFVIMGLLLYTLRYTIFNFLILDVSGDLDFVGVFQYGVFFKLLLVFIVVFCFGFSILCLYRVFFETEKFFGRISQGNKLFSLENILSLKMVSKNLLLWTIFDNFPKFILLFAEPFASMFSFNTFSIVFSLIALCFSYIFQYGNILEAKKFTQK